MKVSLSWLNEYVDLSAYTAQEIANRLTSAGLEVEEIIALSQGDKLVVGYVKKAEILPDTHLSLCQVDTGAKYGLRQIICGAKNVTTGQKVIVALPGARLRDGEIKVTTIKGYESHGMICSLPELGVDKTILSEEQIQGIEVLPSDFEVGHENPLNLLGLNDTIFSLNLLANRPDGNSVYNLAREIAALFSLPIKPLFTHSNIQEIPSEFKVISQTNKCPQFAIKVVHGVNNTLKTPQHITRYLQALGIRGINLLVDIGNYVMLLTGQPVHMYDLDKLPTKTLTVRDDLSTSFIALDKKNYTLLPGDLIITSNDVVACLGGVMGSLATGVDENTKNVAIESANFHFANIRQTSMRLGLVSESSLRFSKGINPHQYQEVLDYAAQLIYETSKATSIEKTVNTLLEEKPLTVIKFAIESINERLGTDFSEQEIVETLERLYFKIKKMPPYYLAEVPSFRIDVKEVADLSEEVIRYQGFGRIKTELPAFISLKTGLSEEQEKTYLIRNYLKDRGLNEVISYTLLSEKESHYWPLIHQDESYVVFNPLSEDRRFVRNHLLYSLLNVAAYNLNRQNKDFSLFEISSIESKNRMSTHLSIVLAGDKKLQGLLQKVPFDFYDIKGLMENMFDLFGIENSRYSFEINPDFSNIFHPGRSAKVKLGGKVIGYCGQLSPLIHEVIDFPKVTLVALEIDLNELLATKVSPLKMREISKYPNVERDLAFLIDKKVPSLEVVRLVKKVSKNLIRDVEVFDVFIGKDIPEDKKSMALRLTLGSDDHTLVDQEVVYLLTKVKELLAATYKVVYRL